MMNAVLQQLHHIICIVVFDSKVLGKSGSDICSSSTISDDQIQTASNNKMVVPQLKNKVTIISTQLCFQI